MDKHTLILTALPNGHRQGGRARLSVYISHRLWSTQADAGARRLDDYPDALDWPARLAAAQWQLELTDGDGQEQLLDLQPDVQPGEPAPLDSMLWRQLFKPDTRVIPYRFDDYRSVDLMMIDQITLHQAIAAIYAHVGGSLDYAAGSALPERARLALDPVAMAPAGEWNPPPVPPSLPATPAGEPPRPDADPDPPPEVELTPLPEPADPPGLLKGCGCLTWPLGLLQWLLRKLLGAEAPWQPGGVAPSGPPPAVVLADDPGPQEDFDAAPAPPASPPPATPVPPVLNAEQQRQRAAFAALAGALAPEAAGAPLPDGDDLDAGWDFHQALSAFGDYPALMRQLGLVVDLLLPEGYTLPDDGHVALRATGLSPSNGIAAFRPRTHFVAAPGTLFTAATHPETPEIVRGFLAIDDPQRYVVVQHEVTGDALKLGEACTRDAASLRADNGTASAAAPRAVGLPALRSSGFSLLRRDTLQELRVRILRAVRLQAALAQQDGSAMPDALPGQPPPLPSADLYAEDLVRGYRVDIHDDSSGRWRSLCQRDGRYRFPSADPGLDLDRDLHDEGFMQFSGNRTTRALMFGQALFTWDGWSLAAPRPGLAVMEDDTPPQEIGNPALTPFKIETTFSATEKSLPRLRFGRRYRMRLRVADLAGNSIVAPEDQPGFDDDGPSCSAEQAALRYEPIAPPALMHQAAPVAGESLERLVIRHFADPGRNASAEPRVSARHLLPPRASQLLVETEGRLDGMTPSAAWNISARESASITDNADLLPADAAPPAGSDPDAEPSEVWVDPNPQVAVGYLPDPRAIGVRLRPDGGSAVALPPLTAGFAGAWPDLQSMRIELHAGVQAEADIVDDDDVRVLRLTLPPGHRARLHFNSRIDPDEADSLGVREWMHQRQPDGLQAAEANLLASDHHMFSPWRDLELVHAAQKPQRKPALAFPGLDTGPDGIAIARRPADSREIALAGSHGETWVEAQLDGHSTGSVHVRADWEDIVDDPAEAKYGKVDRSDVSDPCPAPEGSDAVPLRDALGNPAVLQVHDTRHHLVELTPIATSRYREYFDPDDQGAEDTILAGDPVSLRIPNCATPSPPRLRYALPIFPWQATTEQDGSIVHVRQGGGLRLYLERSWYQTGIDELLGVLYGNGEWFPEGTDKQATHLTVWGSDPTRSSAYPQGFAGPDAFIDALYPRHGLRSGDATVSVAGYAPLYNEQRQLWYADLRIDPGADAWWPFVRLALARYQPHSIDGRHLSAPVLADYIQLPAPRTARIRRNGGELLVEVSGPTLVGSDGDGKSRLRLLHMEAVLERYGGEAGGNDPLHWQAVGEPLELLPEHGSWEPQGRWKGVLPIAGGGQRQRVTIRESLHLRGDNLPAHDDPGHRRRRLLYADSIEFPA